VQTAEAGIMSVADCPQKMLGKGFGKMSSGDHFKIKKSGCSYILYDASIMSDPTLQLFDADYHTKQSTQQKNSSSCHDSDREKSAGAGIGRARAVYFQHEDKALVLKHYYRGGMVARFIKDRYLGINIENSRAFREWRLLNKMYHLGLPVPRALAAHVEKGLISYTADLITEELKDSKTLAEVLTEKSIDEKQWKKIGACISLFHQHNVYHADLNARNILLTGSGDVYLIDFDNSYIRLDSASWKMANLARLKRSLLKFKRNEKCFNFDEANWSILLQGYM
jgi:3-deoxy-D-manno-octulosonic acid kinase